MEHNYQNESCNATLNLVDSHAHLDDTRFEADIDAVIRRAQTAGVKAIITVGVNLASSRAAARLSRLYANVGFAAGIHPQEVATYDAGSMTDLNALITESRPLAIGEIGLDCAHDAGSLKSQIELLKAQLKLAREAGLPVIIHCRGAEAHLLPVLSEWVKDLKFVNPGVIHCFSGALDIATAYIRLGFSLSVGAYIGYPSSRKLRETLQQVPLANVMLETDCPYLPPQPRRGQRNEPAYMVETVRALAEIKGLEITDIARQTTENARSLFKIDI